MELESNLQNIIFFLYKLSFDVFFDAREFCEKKIGLPFGITEGSFVPLIIESVGV